MTQTKLRVVVPYAPNAQRTPPHPGLMPETIQALEAHCPVEPRYVDVSVSPFAYFELLDELWQDDRSDLVVIEHDIVVKPGVFEGFRSCRQPWCANPYPKDSAPELLALGCVRFRKSLIANTSGLWGRVARHGNDAQVGDGMPSRHWVRNDGRMALELGLDGYGIHRHEPVVGHLNPGEWRSA